MAGLVESYKPRAQLTAIATVRWQIFLHSLRSKRGALELFSRIVIDDTYLVVHETSGVALPQRRPVLCTTAGTEEEYQTKRKNRCSSHVTWQGVDNRL